MTEHLKELLPNPTCVDYQHPSDGHGYDLYDEVKMIEYGLKIVRECIAQIQPMWDLVQEFGPPPGYDTDTFDLAYNDCMSAIEEHFGNMYCDKISKMKIDPMPAIVPALLKINDAQDALYRASKSWNRSQLIDAIRSARYFLDVASAELNDVVSK